MNQSSMASSIIGDGTVSGNGTPTSASNSTGNSNGNGTEGRVPPSLPRKPKPNANPLRPLQRPRKGNPLVARKRPEPPKPQTSKPAGVSKPKPPTAPSQPSLQEKRRKNGGWSESPPPDVKVQYFPVFATKNSLREGIRYHVMRFARPRIADDEKLIDPSDQDEFARPVTLNRRDPRMPPPARAPKDEPVPDAPPPTQEVDEKEAERLAQLKAEREAQRAIDQAKIAPTMTEAVPKKRKKQKEEKISVYNRPRKIGTDAQKESALRYEEALPWHLEDADGRNVWVGNYVAALSEGSTSGANVAFVIDRPGFRMIPLEKYYKFSPKPPFVPYSLDQAEEMMSRGTEIARWVKRDQEKEAAQQEWAASRRFINGPPGIKFESATSRAASRGGGGQDLDDAELSGDEFSDDDENVTYEHVANEDEKDTKDRIRRNQLGANLFGDGDEQEVDREMERLLKEEENRRTLGKKLKKALIKREHETRYASESSSDDDPFLSSSDEDSSEDEEAEIKKEDEVKNNNGVGTGNVNGNTNNNTNNNNNDNNDNNSSINNNNNNNSNNMTEADLKNKAALAAGVSSKGATNAPAKKAEPKKTKSLKRPGSPNLSESSGTESSRKKGKVSKGKSGGAVAAGVKKIKAQHGIGSGSDGEVTAGEMSDSQPPRKKKVKLLDLDGKGTPSASRAASPAAATAATVPALPPPSTSNTTATSSTILPAGAASPASLSAADSLRGGAVEPWEIIAELTTEGISIPNLMRAFGSRVGDRPGQMPRKDFIKMVKETCQWGPDKLLRRKSDIVVPIHQD